MGLWPTSLLLAWGAPAALLLFAAPVSADDASRFSQRRDALDATWSQTLAELASKCRELKRDDLAEKTTAWHLPPLSSGQRLFLPPAPSEDPSSEGELTQFWQRRFLDLRRRRGAGLFDLAKSVAASQPETALQLLHEVLREDPEHSAARQILGYRRIAGAWIRGPARQTSRMPANAKYRLPAGHWRIRTEHFEILSEPGEAAGRELAGEIEAVHGAWSQLFYSFANDPAALARRFEAPQKSTAPTTQRHRVVLYKSRQNYLAALQPKERLIGVTVGIYLPADRASYFYWDEDPPRSTWRHEVTHQLFSESRRVALNAGLRRNFWLLEGIAMYMESVTPRSGYCTVGGVGVDRLQFARYRQAPRTGEALTALVQMGRGDMQRSERVSELYSEAAGLCCFLMDGEGGRHRQHCRQLLALVYQDRDEAQNLFQVTGLAPEPLLRRYHAFLADVDDQDLADLGPLGNLCLKTTEVTDKGLRQLDVSRLEWLDLTGRPISDEALIATLGKAGQLSQLTLEGTQATDRLFAGEPLLAARWPRLTELDLSQTKVTDRTVARLRPLQGLEVLWLTATQVTDASIGDLLELKNLTILEIGGSGVSPDGARRLRQGLPKLERLGQ